MAAYVQVNLRSMDSEAKHDSEMWRHLWPATEILQTHCTKIVYKINSKEEILLLNQYLDNCNLDSEKMCRTLLHFSDDPATTQALVLFQQLSIHLKYKDCPLGFVLHEIDRNCVCQTSISPLGLTRL